MLIVIKEQNSENTCHLINIRSQLIPDVKTVTVIKRLEIITWKKILDHDSASLRKENNFSVAA